MRVREMGEGELSNLCSPLMCRVLGGGGGGGGGAGGALKDSLDTSHTTGAQWNLPLTDFPNSRHQIF